MQLSSATNKELILLDKQWGSREEVLENICKVLFEQGIVSDAEKFLHSVWERENISETGFDNGIAIPHGKSTTVIKPGFAAVRLKNPLSEWPSMKAGNKVDLIFLLAIPEDDTGAHLKLLSTLSTSLMDEQRVAELKTAADATAFLNILDAVDDNKPVIENTKQETIIVITSCSAGIAHTYMAAEALEKAGAARGVRVLSEKQGANGIEDQVSTADIKGAAGVIFAADLPPKGKERFNGKKYISTNVSEPLKDADGLIERMLTHPDGVVEVSDEHGDMSDADSKKSVWGRLYQGVLTGISYMIPVIVAAGLMIGVGQLGASFLGVLDIANADYATNPNQILVIFHYLTLYGNMIMKFMYPVFAAYMAYSIADRPGLVPGFIGGAFAAGLHYTFWSVQGGIPSGFFGALILGAVAGFVADFLNKKIQLHKNLKAMKPMFLIPGITVLIIFFLNFYFVDPVFGGINKFLQDFIVANQASGGLVLAIIITSLTAFDLGGPVNKSAGAIAIGLAADGIFPLTARVLGIVIPPIGIGLATVIDKLVVKRRVFDANQRVTGSTSLILGFLAIGEGAIPFMLKNPVITISINILGAIIGSVTAITLGAVQWYPLPAIWGWPLVQNLPAYLIGMTAGILFIALANIFIRYYLVKKGKIIVD